MSVCINYLSVCLEVVSEQLKGVLPAVHLSPVLLSWSNDTCMFVYQLTREFVRWRAPPEPPVSPGSADTCLTWFYWQVACATWANCPAHLDQLTRNWRVVFCQVTCATWVTCPAWISWPSPTIPAFNSQQKSSKILPPLFLVSIVWLAFLFDEGAPL